MDVQNDNKTNVWLVTTSLIIISYTSVYTCKLVVAHTETKIRPLIHRIVRYKREDLYKITSCRDNYSSSRALFLENVFKEVSWVSSKEETEGCKEQCYWLQIGPGQLTERKAMTRACVS